MLGSKYRVASITTPYLSSKGRDKLLEIFKKVKRNFSNDWLLPLELYELTKNYEILDHLKSLQEKRPEIAHLIEGGLGLIKKE